VAVTRQAAERAAAMDKARYVRAMFTRIAARYDLMNTLMTAGRDRVWRDAVARATIAAPAGLVLDLATGTADLALAIARLTPYRRVIGADFAEGMLRHAQPKLRRYPRLHVSLLAADALELPFQDATFACVTSAFLLRNLSDLGRGLAEMRRVTRPGGRIVTLDIVLDNLEKSHDWLLKGDVFTPDVIETWIDYKRKNEVDPIRLRPHPWEFALYFDI